MTDETTAAFGDCTDCEGRGGGPCHACTGGSADCDVCNGKDWQECDRCSVLADALKCVREGGNIRRFTHYVVADARARGYLDGELKAPHLTFKGRKWL